MHVLVTCMSEENPIKNEGAKVAKHSPIMSLWGVLETTIVIEFLGEKRIIRIIILLIIIRAGTPLVSDSFNFN